MASAERITSHCDYGFRAHEVCYGGNTRAFGMLEPESGSAGFDRAVGDFRDLEDRIHLARNSLEFAFSVQFAQKLSQVSISHLISLGSAERNAMPSSGPL